MCFRCWCWPVIQQINVNFICANLRASAKLPWLVTTWTTAFVWHFSSWLQKEHNTKYRQYCVKNIRGRLQAGGTYNIARTNADVATWASEVQRTVLFLPKFESEAEVAKGVKFRNYDDASLSRHLHHFRYLCSAVRLFLIVGSESSTQFQQLDVFQIT